MRCQLCLEDKTLCKSHIIPEYFYDRLYTGNRLLEIQVSGEGRPSFYRQKGIREKLLCKECETYLSRFENYAKTLFEGGYANITHERIGRIAVCKGLDYHKFKIFQLSVLWRAGVSADPMFSNIKLGRHQEILRRMIVDGDPGESYSYGCGLFFPISPDGGLIDIIATADTFVDDLNYKHYRLFFGGAIWAFIIGDSSHTRRFPYKRIFLQPDGTLMIYSAPASETDYFREAVRLLRKRRREVEAIMAKGQRSLND